MMRRSPARYSDGIYEMAGRHRPNPLDISQHVHSGPAGTSSAFNRNAMSVFFGQLVLDEILSTGQRGCPPEYENLPIPSDHPLANHTDRPMMYQRSDYDHTTGNNNPRQQTNGVTAFVDGGVIYGNAKLWTDQLRNSAGNNGMLLVNGSDILSSFPETNHKQLPLSNQPPPRDHSLKSATRLFAIGNAKGHETPQLLALQVVWHRYHNAIAQDIKDSVNGSNVTDDQIFNTARKRVIAHFQKIVMEEWLPAFLNGNETEAAVLENYSGYHREVRPDITQEFRTAMNFRYSLMPSAVWTLGRSSGNLTKTFTRGRGPDNEPRNVTSLRLCNQFWDSQDVVRNNLDEILRGMLFTYSEREDPIISPDLRASFYGSYEFTRQDVVGLEIQRDRDHGIADLNTVLQAYGLPAITSWNQLQQAQDLQRLYGNSTAPTDLDLFTGGLLTRSTDYVHGMPRIFREIIVDQFRRLRSADRFWYLNHLNNSQMFTPDEVSEINQITFKDVLRKTTSLSDSDLSTVFLCTGQSCLAPPSLNDSDPEVDVCTPLKTYDYFIGSEASFALSWIALALVVPASVAMLLMLARQRGKSRRLKAVKALRQYRQRNPNKFKAREWQGPASGERNVTAEFHPVRKKLVVRDGVGKELRFIDLRRTQTAEIRRPASNLNTVVSVRIDGEVDLILKFLEPEECQMFYEKLVQFLNTLNITIGTFYETEEEIKRESVNRDDRQSVLDDFFRAACLQAWPSDAIPFSEIGRRRRDDVLRLRLTRTEFAEALGMTPSSIFVRNVFVLGDADDDGFITFDEFLALFAVFIKGTAEEKAQLMFNVYDVRQKGELTRDDFYRMIRPHERGRDDLPTLQESFVSSEYASIMQSATLSNTGTAVQHGTRVRPRDIGRRKHEFVESYRNQSQEPVHRRSYIRVSGYEPRPEVERYSRLKYWYSCLAMCSSTLSTSSGSASTRSSRAAYLLKGRTSTHSVARLREGEGAGGLRRMSGPWTSVMTRGSASVIMFTFASLLLTMCRNIITKLRETFLHRYIPFDSAVTFHKYIAVLALIATVIHIVGHALNLYCMCTQSTTNLNCFFREFYTASDKVATFHYWAFQTITGLTGVVVTVVLFVMYVFSVQWARRNIFRAFWVTHMLYPLVYLLTLLHGLGCLVQDPLFAWYLLGPLVLFVLDRLASVSRNKIEIPVLKAELLPSDVLKLEFKRPSNFAYKSGQWVRIACLKLGKGEYHPFTLTSAPHQRNLTLYIRAVGPWTINLRSVYDKNLLGGDPYPKLYLDGPFGEGHQDWYTFEVSVLVGGGIGVTPFASILKDIAFKSRTGASISCQKVYFMWVTRTQKSFEWMTDVIREVEATDSRQVVDVHIFITQFQQKYDLRTSMLYICERRFQKVEGRSLFTGLRAITHFGRPNFLEFFTCLGMEHPGLWSRAPDSDCASRLHLHEQKGRSHVQSPLRELLEALSLQHQPAGPGLTCALGTITVTCT
ncbi:hypothetical protein C0Q70_20227 [Pomacea canaliculata]|uniref:NAD(P)H oxidase (H2O2-forming) n=1 Tax=Pomacea canaliculata TaxID=400727 RepID=A0A2T7NEZ6_POMCA|nr:hypothetical protein C0Q70_20227 [Pomacea canaliculata]